MTLTRHIENYLIFAEESVKINLVDYHFKMPDLIFIFVITPVIGTNTGIIHISKKGD